MTRWVEAILLDLYDTLVEPDWTALQATRDAIARRVGVDPALARASWQALHPRRMRGLYGGLEGDLEAVFAACGVSVPEEFRRELAEQEFGSWARGVRLYQDVRPSLARLRAEGYRLAIVSNASCEAASVVGVLGLDACVDAVILSCEIGALKPEPEMLRIALERVGSPPARAVLVDDQEGNLLAARSMGMAAVLMARGGAPDAPGAITGLDELDVLLRQRDGPRRRIA